MYTDTFMVHILIVDIDTHICTSIRIEEPFKEYESL